MAWQVMPIDRRHVAGFHDVLDGVAREGRWLAMLEAPPLHKVRRFVLDGLAAGNPQFVAVDGRRVVGWCDVTRRAHPTLRHSGVLGMGVAAAHRGLGIGAALLDATLGRSAACGITRVELVVRADNVAAIALYRRRGFELEGRLRGYLIVDGQPQDALQMARLE